LKILACVKLVPDSAATVTVEGGRVTWGDAKMVINPWDEYAVEVGLQQTEALGGDVIALTMGKEQSTEALKHALAMGVKEAILVSDPALAETDSVGVAQVLAAAIRKAGGVDMVVFGKQAIDSDSGATSVQTGRVLGWSVLTLVSKVRSVDPAAGSIVVERSIEEGEQVVEAKLPVVLSFVKKVAEPRYPSFIGIRKAAKAQIPTWSLADLGITAPAAVVHWPEVLNLPKREIVTEIITGDTPEQIAEKLADKIMAEKVL